MADYVGAIDQGTTSTRFMIFDHAGQVVAVDQKEHEQIFPKPGWVEHDPYGDHGAHARGHRGRAEKAGISGDDLAAVGVTNQRETTVVWERSSGKPIHNALVWQDTRTDQICNELSADGGQDRFRAATGLPIATYFSGPKIRWILDNVEGARARAEAGELLFGNIDTWVIWNITGGPDGGAHVTDVTNASRTMLMDLQTLDWDDAILDAIGVPGSVLPEIRSSSQIYGEATGRPGRHPGRGRPRGPAGRPVRPDLLRGRRGQEHLRHRQLPAAEHGHEGRAVQERTDHRTRLQDRRPTRDVHARGFDRDHRRARAVAPRQPRADLLLGRGRGPGQDGRGQRRRLLRAGVLRPVRAVLAERRARRDRRASPAT